MIIVVENWSNIFVNGSFEDGYDDLDSVILMKLWYLLFLEQAKFEWNTTV